MAVLVRVNKECCLLKVLICLFKALHILHTVDKVLLSSCIELVDQEHLVECQLSVMGLVLGQIGTSELRRFGINAPLALLSTEVLFVVRFMRP